MSGWYLEADPRAVVDASLQVVRDVGCHQLSPLPPTFAEAASFRSVRDALTAREIESASGSTEDDWVASSAAKAVIEMIEYRSAPDHIASRRRLAKLAGKAGADWEELEPLLQSSTDPSVAALAKLTGAKDAEALLEAVENLEIDDPDWPDDLGQLEIGLAVVRRSDGCCRADVRQLPTAHCSVSAG